MVRKKNWKRIDVSAVQESLVESNIAKSVAKTDIQDDIVIDVEGHVPSKRLARKLKSQKYVGPLAQRGAVERAKLQRLVKKLKHESQRMDVDDDAQSKQPTGNDIWGEGDEKQAKRRPKDLNLYKVIPAVAAPHSGQSYNPAPEEYEKLVERVIETMPKEQLESDEPLTSLIRESLPSLELEGLSFRRKQKLASLIVQKKLDQEAVMQVLEEVSDDGSEQEEEENMESEEARRSRKLKKKTKAQRNKQRIHRENVRRLLARKRVKKLVHDIQNLRSNLRELEGEGTKRAKEPKSNRLKNYLRSLIQGKEETRFGNKVYKVDPEHVALPEEITSSVRRLKTPLRSPVENVVRSIYSRGLVPPPPVMDKKYRDYVTKKVIKRSMKYKSKLLSGTT